MWVLAFCVEATGRPKAGSQKRAVMGGYSKEASRAAVKQTVGEEAGGVCLGGGGRIMERPS